MSNSPDSSPGIPSPQTDVGDLRTFVAVARAGGVSRAAELLGRTQPAVSARISALERAWDTRLFRRVARGMVATPEGRRLLPLAEAVLRELEKLDHEAGRPITPGGELRVGAGDALGRRTLPRAMRRLIDSYPELEVRVREGPGPLLLEALRSGEIDLALVVESGAGGRHEGLDVAPWVRSEVMLMSPGRRGGGSRRVTLSALRDERLITLQPGSGFRRHLEAAFAAADVPFRPGVEVGNLSLVRRFVATGLGVALVPEVAFSAADNASRVTLRPVRDVPPVFYARVLRAGAPVSEPITHLLRLLRR